MARTSVKSDFQRKKEHILQQLAVPLGEYEDLSPKGSVDVEIRDLIDEINSHGNLITTSSCAGRISVFLEGDRASKQENSDRENASKPASEGGKGGGGRWLYISHMPLMLPEANETNSTSAICHETFGLKESDLTSTNASCARFVHFKFEPMILHILCANVQIAQQVLSSALQAGFRESGATSISPPAMSQAGVCPMVAVRSTGLAFDSIVGIANDSNAECQSVVGEPYLKTLLAIANERFRVNTQRIQRFQEVLRAALASSHEPHREDWEDASLRRERKVAEGKQRQIEVHLRKQQRPHISENEPSPTLS